MQQPIHGVIDKFSDNYLALSEQIIRDMRRLMRGGTAPEQAVAEAWQKNGVTRKLTDWMTESVLVAVQAGGPLTITDVQGMREYLLSQVWPGAQMSLSAQIHTLDAGMRQVIVETLREQLAANKSWTATAKAIDDLSLTSGDIAGSIKQLERLGRRALTGDSASAYAKELRKAQNHINRLALNGAPTSRLRKAYQSVLDATVKGNQKALDNALKRAVRAKARYNAERVARTEIARAYGEGVMTQIHADDDVVGYRSVLSSRHEEVDICDFHAEADLYGMGPGVYPKDQGPPYPYHPFCTCILQPVYRGTAGEYSPEQAQKYLQAHPRKRKAMLGKGGNAAFKDNPASWQGRLPGWHGHETKRATIPTHLMSKNK